MKLHVYSGRDRRAVLAALAAGRESAQGPARLVIPAVSSGEAAARSAAARAWLTGEGPPVEGVVFRETPLAGEVAFVYTNGAAAYRGMGQALMRAFPAIMDDLEERCGPLNEVAGWAYLDGDVSVTALEQIWGAALLSQLHTEITRGLLSISPNAVIGYSSGESSAFVALRAWRDVRTLVADSRSSELFASALAGEFGAIRRAWRRAGVDGDRWVNYAVSAPVHEVRTAIAAEPAVHLMAINSPDSCVVGGEASGCERVLRRIGASRALPLDYEIAVHAPELAEIREQWWRLHHRPTHDVPGVRFYSCAMGECYLATGEAAADAMTAQALSTVDFAGTVERAWADGVRVFIEHGPRSLCTGWIRRTLSDREHLAVAMDVTHLGELATLAAELVAAGVPVNLGRLFGYAEEPVRPAPTVATRHRRQVAAIHEDFLARQAHIQERFLQVTALGEASRSRGERAAGSERGFSLTTADLEKLAAGPVSAVFGRLFSAQDSYPRQTRVPQPPMLMMDRVTHLDAEPGALLRERASATGVIRTETDVAIDSWYLDATGRMPVGLMIEAGQGDLLLMSWLGSDLLYRGERVYRLVSAELTFHGSPPAAGETLSYEIHVDGHGEHVSFFRGECRVGGELRLTGRNCVAGFFTEDELARGGGVLWDPESEPCDDPGPLDVPMLPCPARKFGPDEVRAFSEGRPADCFGSGWDVSRSHVRSPRIPDGRMRALREVTEFDPEGGPWRRGYLRAEMPVEPDAWYFAGHFKNDPCMPGSLMFEGCLQAMAFYLAAAGFTVDRDGWRFEPVPEQPYRLRCRGQVTPGNRLLAYEVFVTSLSAGPEPTLFADVLCSVDGVKAFHARRVGLRLVPDWPLSYWRSLGPPAVQTTGEPVEPRRLAGLRGHQEPGRVAVVDGFAFDGPALLAYAWGKPSEAFGPAYAAFDGPRRIARLPAPPYSFVSRIASVAGPPDGMRTGSRVEAEYDVPAEAWYFEQNGYPAMPFGVLMEVVLQACGWLGFYVGSARTSDSELLIRNLDGKGTVVGEVLRGARTLRTRAELCRVSRSADSLIESFTVECLADGKPVVELSSVFGYFPPQAFEQQLGLPPTDAEFAWFGQPADRVVDLTARPARYCEGTLRLAGPMLLMLDRITGYWPTAGRAGLGRLRADKDVDPAEWFFKAHFFQDPVQPGSLGVEAMCQLLQFYLIERDAGAGLRCPRFEPVLPGREVSWRYRGQVLPTHERITVEMEIVAAGEDDRGRYAVADAWLWVDGKRIYRVEHLGMRVVDGGRE